MEVWEFIKIYGTRTQEGEVFQGAGLFASYGKSDPEPVALTTPTQATTATAATTPTIPALLWTAQINLINQHTEYLADVKEIFGVKQVELPSNFSLAQFFRSEAFQWIVFALLKLIPGEIDDLIWAMVAEYVGKLLGLAVEELKKIYNAGSRLCERMRDENQQLLALDTSFEAYRLRSQILQQHDMSIQSLMLETAAAETRLAQIQTANAEADKSELLKYLELTSKVYECPYSGWCTTAEYGPMDIFADNANDEG